MGTATYRDGRKEGSDQKIVGKQITTLPILEDEEEKIRVP